MRRHIGIEWTPHSKCSPLLSIGAEQKTHDQMYGGLVLLSIDERNEIYTKNVCKHKRRLCVWLLEVINTNREHLHDQELRVVASELWERHFGVDVGVLCIKRSVSSVTKEHEDGKSTKQSR